MLLRLEVGTYIVGHSTVITGHSNCKKHLSIYDNTADCLCTGVVRNIIDIIQHGAIEG